eukprot:TRINITY_DN4339_c0_g1_i4.p3 TRINITY_DN4339_c0_g1~~TRINITY_DN4339_c0_g1_i4.p3  ORF type:complete len:217 (+),score=-12.25 TRINITY_DN4339_c0_g1_i4:876-1526(+)
MNTKKKGVIQINLLQQIYSKNTLFPKFKNQPLPALQSIIVVGQKKKETTFQFCDLQLFRKNSQKKKPTFFFTLFDRCIPASFQLTETLKHFKNSKKKIRKNFHLKRIKFQTSDKLCGKVLPHRKNLKRLTKFWGKFYPEIKQIRITQKHIIIQIRFKNSKHAIQSLFGFSLQTRFGKLYVQQIEYSCAPFLIIIIIIIRICKICMQTILNHYIIIQ